MLLESRQSTAAPQYHPRRSLDVLDLESRQSLGVGASILRISLDVLDLESRQSKDTKGTPHKVSLDVLLLESSPTIHGKIGRFWLVRQSVSSKSRNCLVAALRVNTLPGLSLGNTETFFVRLSVKPFSVIRTLLWLAVMAAGAWLHAADADQRHQMEIGRIDFERSMIEASLTPLKKHLTELTLLEKERAEAKNYSGAIEARDLRRRVEEELERLDKELLLLQTREQSLKSSLLEDRVTLPIDAAELKGVNRTGGTLTGWSKPGATAKWMLPALPPGGYEVILRYRCGPLEGGSVTIQESRFSLTGDIDTTLKGPQEKNLGTLKITDGAGPLAITARTVVKDNLMQLLGVALVPSSR